MMFFPDATENEPLFEKHQFIIAHAKGRFHRGPQKQRYLHLCGLKKSFALNEDYGTNFHFILKASIL